ncbi:MAG TPA: SRPBCC domain-containing protein [Thermoanaerobaculia bacterium]|nr:SRPBCC domain-containing protein [Thermoanaerobaculia bacterium]
MERIRQGDIPGVQLRRRQPLPVPCGEAWPWLVEPDRLGRWLAPAPGETLRPLETDPPRRLLLSWEETGWRAPTRVTLQLHPAAVGCELDVLHQGFERLPLSTCLTVWEAYRRRWREALARLAAALA